MKNNHQLWKKGAVLALFPLIFSACKEVEVEAGEAESNIYVNLQHSGTTENLRSVHFFDASNGLTVGTTGGMYRTANGGQSWTKSFPIPMDTAKSMIDTTIVYNRIYFQNSQNGWILGTYNARTATSTTVAARKTALLKTQNGGVSWVNKNFDSTVKTFTAIRFFDENIGYVIGNAGLIYKTNDGGNTWTQQISGVSSNLRDITIISSNTAMIVGPNGVLLKTQNGGETWEKLTTPGSRAFYKIKFINSLYGYIVGGGEGNTPNADKAFVYKIDIHGNFTDLTNKYYSVFYLYGVHSSTDGNELWTAGHLGQIFRSKDGGKTWSDELSKSQRSEILYDISFPTERIGYFVGDGGVVLKVDLDRE
ncbi:YCF48-related protein [Arcicella sp. LKC2W]|uniref:WD40/YVTN/BNR-like repeat-containing protein n=1 Tax=Arcicella sp. LKC2W TaxID=2984198 RepID=UPI002B20E7CE|nr:YCF48-related protein [Arcicella sp. LKC2W]MEA5461867.1 YCF48-related protein [Arcicella sp. LKC2W]